jgi:isopenicillin N synthase-like dioxygenase
VPRNFRVPVIDISTFQTGDPATRASLARLVDDTFTESGFMAIVGHGIPDEVVNEAKAAARKFFAQDDEEKAQWHRPGDRSHGYFPKQSIASARYGERKDAPPDLMESYAIGSSGPAPWSPDVDVEGVAGPNTWPDSPADFHPKVARYFAAVEGLVGELMRMFALALRLDEEYFVPFYTPYIGVVRMNLYGRLVEEPEPDQIRIGAHTDLGGFTVLSADTVAGGLQIQDFDGNWHDVNPPENSFVINLGDLMQTWTNDRWRATLHRVTNPQTPEQNIDRLSVAFFANPNPETVCECIPTCLDPGEKPMYEPFVAGEFRQRRMATQHVASAGLD